MHISPLLTQVILILVLSRLMSSLLRAAAQPAVIGEIVAGVLLGPLVFGKLAPELQTKLFSPADLSELKGLSELGLVLFMFVAGAGLRTPARMRTPVVTAGWIGSLSFAVPLLLGLGVGQLLYPYFAPPGVGRWAFALFIGTALSITALPVMARIVKDRHLSEAAVGYTSLAAATVTDVLSWTMLLVLTTFVTSNADWTGFARQSACLVVLIIVMLGLVRPLFAKLVRNPQLFATPDSVPQAVMLIGLFCCAQATELAGAHAAFGSFLFGLCVPREERAISATVRGIEQLAALVFMPIFFAFAGLSTTSAALTSASLGALALVLVAATLGKLAGASVGARVAGYSWRTALGIGSLMNARGLVELIAIKIGLDTGVIEQSMFTILLIMAAATTLLTGPLLNATAHGRGHEEISEELLGGEV